MKKLPKINIIGAGSVGQTFAHLINLKHAGKIHQVINRTIESTKQAIEFIGAGYAIDKIEDFEPADIVIIATPEDAIEAVCTALINHNKLLKGSVLMHHSGVLTAQVLNLAKKAGINTGRVHPLKGMKNPREAVDSFSGTFCALEGNKKFIDTLAPIITIINGIPITLNEQTDCYYHAISTLVFAYPQILLSAVAKGYEACGVDKKMAIRLALELFKNSLESISPDGDYTDFVQGPIQRSDVDLISMHQISLKSSPEINQIYRALGQYAIHLSQSNEDKKEQILELLTSKV